VIQPEPKENAARKADGKKRKRIATPKDGVNRTDK